MHDKIQLSTVMVFSMPGVLLKVQDPKWTGVCNKKQICNITGKDHIFCLDGSSSLDLFSLALNSLIVHHSISL